MCRTVAFPVQELPTHEPPPLEQENKVCTAVAGSADLSAKTGMSVVDSKVWFF